MIIAFFVLGVTGAVLLLGSFFVEGAPHIIMGLLGTVLFVAYRINKIIQNSKKDKSE